VELQERRNMMKYFIGAFIIILSFLINGCATRPPIELPSQNITLKYKKPKIELVPPSNRTQGNKKVLITVNALKLKGSELKYKVKYKKLPMDASECCIAGLSVTGLCSEVRTFEKTVIPYYEIPKQDLVFEILIENHLGHILYLDRSVVTVEVNDELVYWSGVRYLPLSNLFEDIILPDEESEPIKITIPIDNLLSPSKIVLTIYDIPTDVDAAGNVRERSSYKWNFRYIVEEKMVQKQITKERIKLKIH